MQVSKELFLIWDGVWQLVRELPVLQVIKGIRITYEVTD